PRMLVLDDPGLLERSRDVVHGRAGDARAAQHFEPRLTRPFAERLVEDRRELVAAAVAVGERRKFLGQVGTADRVAQEHPELLLRTGDHDPPVRGPEVLERDDRGVGGVPPPRRRVPARGRPGADVHQLVQGGVEQRYVAVAARAFAAGAPETGPDWDRPRVPPGK